MSLRQLRTRLKHLEHLEEKSQETVNSEKYSARARWEELRLKEWKQKNRPNEVEKPLAEEEEAELKELFYRCHPLGLSVKAWEEAAAKDWSSGRRRPRPNET
jgi:hypothetical protein